MSTEKKFFFINTRTFLLVFILFLTLNIIYLIIFSHEAFAMDPYHNINYDEDMISDEDISSELIISGKETYMSYNGIYTEKTRLDLFRSLYPNGLPVYSNIINDYYDNEAYFDIPITMIYGGSENTNLSSGIYSGCKGSNIDGLLIWPERNLFHVEFIKDYTQVIYPKSIISSVGLGTKTDGHHVVFVYIECQDIYEYKYYWTIWERTHIAKYWSYKAFKKRWDNEINIWSNIDDNIRKDIIIEVKDLLGMKRVDKNIRKSVRTEIEKLIRKTEPFSTSSS